MVGGPGFVFVMLQWGRPEGRKAGAAYGDRTPARYAGISRRSVRLSGEEGRPGVRAGGGEAPHATAADDSASHPMGAGSSFFAGVKSTPRVVYASGGGS
jgi:hypothetical protein